MRLGLSRCHPVDYPTVTSTRLMREFVLLDGKPCTSLAIAFVSVTVIVKLFKGQR